MLNQPQVEKPAALATLEELKKVADASNDPQEKQAFAELEAQTLKERAEAVKGLGHNATNYVEVGNAGNVVLPEQEVIQANQQGQELGPTERRS